MRKIILLPLLSFLLSFYANGQEAKPGEELKSKFVSTKSPGWEALFTEHKSGINEALVDGWRADAITMYGNSEYEAAELLINVCLHLSDDLHNLELKGKCLLVKAEIHFYQQDYKSAIAFAEQAGAALTPSGNKLQIARTKHRIGLCYYALEDYKKSIKAFEESIAIKTQLISADPENKSYAESLYGTYDKYGDALYSEGLYDKEIEINKASIVLVKKWGWYVDEAYTNYCLGWTYSRAKKEYAGAIPYYDESIRGYLQAKDTAFLMINYRELIKVLEADNKIEKGRTEADKAIVLAIAWSNKPDAMEFMDYFIKRYKEDGAVEDGSRFYLAKEKLFSVADSLKKFKSETAEYYKSKELYDQSIAKYQEVLALPLTDVYRADLYWSMAIVLEAQKNYVKEVEYFQEALKYYSTTQKQYNHIVLLSNIGIVYRNQEDSTHSLKAHDQAIDVALSNPDSINLKHAFDKAGDSFTHFNRPNYKMAILLKTYRAMVALKDFDKAGESAKLVAKAYEETFLDFDKAETYYKLSIEHYEKTKDATSIGDAWWNLAYNQGENKKDYKGSITAYEKGLAYYSSLKDTVNMKTVISNMAINYRMLEDSVNSYKEHNRAIALTLKNSNPENLVYAYDKAIKSYEHFNDNKKVRATLLKKYEIYKKKNNYEMMGSVMQALAKNYEKEPQDKRTANQYFTIAIEHYKKSGEKSGLAHVYWGNAYDQDVYQKNTKASLDSYKKSITLFTELKDSTDLQSVLANVSIIYRDLGDSVNAYKNIKQAIDLVRTNPDQELLIYCLQVSAENYGRFKHYGKQLGMVKWQLTIYEKSDNRIKIASTLKAAAKVFEEGYKNFSEADAYYVKAIDLLNTTSDLDARANMYWSRGYNKKENLLDYPTSIVIFETGYDLFIQNKDTSNASVMRSNVAQTYWAMEDFQKAIENHKKAVALATKAKKLETIYKSWNSLADLYKKTDNPVNSTEALGNAIVALEALKDSTQLATAYAGIADSYGKSKDYLKCFSYYGKAVAIRKALKDTASWASVLYSWGNVYSLKSDFKLAEEKFRSSFELHHKTKDRANEAYDLISLGAMEHGGNNDYKKAEVYYNQAVTIAKALNDEFVLSFCYAQMKLLYQSTGRVELAEANSIKALEIYKKLKNWKGVAQSLSGMAHDAYYVKGDLSKAMNLYDQAQAIADTLSDKTTLADIYEGQASVYEERGEFTKSLEFIDKSYALYNSVQNEWGIAGTCIERGNVYKSISEYEKAMKYQFMADSMYLKLGTEYARLAPLANIGGNYMAMGNYTKGLEYCMKAFEIINKAGDMNTNMCIIKDNVGEAYYYLEDFKQAEKWMTDARETAVKVGAKRTIVDIDGSLGRLKIEQKKYGEAEVFIKEGLLLGKEIEGAGGYLNVLVLSGKLQYEQKQYDKAKVSLDESSKIAHNIGRDNVMWESLYLQGLVQKATGNLKQSKDYLKESVTIIEKLRNKVVGGEDAQKLFSSDKNILKVYDALVEVLLALGETEEAMTYIQKNNDDNLKAKFRGMDVKFENEEKNNALLAERAMKAKLDGIEEQIHKEKQLGSEKQSTEKLKNLEGVKTIAESEYLKFVNQQINVQPELSKFFNNSVQPTQFRKIKAKIPKDMALLSYLAGENQLYIFAATSDTVVAKIVNVSRAQLIKDINAMLNVTRNSMGTFLPVDLKTELAERKEIVNNMKQTDVMIKPFEDAYHYLIAPVSKEIAGKSRLGIIPTGALNYIPFQMLGKTLENGKFSLMMNQFAIFYANSTDMLFRDESEDTKNYNILAFGNPDKSLPATEKEVNDIKRMFPSASVFLRDEATEDRAKYADEKYNVMHFATHGNLDYEDFSKSYLTMAGNPAKSEDGRLTLEELWGMDVMTHLNIVVLSACQTAVTKGSNESSAVSPASGFLQNGVKSVVATLWKVDDEATSLLISDFYKNLKTMDAVDALRTAQVNLATNKKFSHPYYWAAVVLLGDWR